MQPKLPNIEKISIQLGNHVFSMDGDGSIDFVYALKEFLLKREGKLWKDIIDELKKA